MEENNKYYNRLRKLSSSDLLLILHDCVDILQPVSPSYMGQLIGREKKTVLNQIEAGKYLVFEFDDRKFPIVNDHLKGSV